MPPERGVPDQWEELADAAVPPDLDGAADAAKAVEALHEAVGLAAGSPPRARAAAEACDIRNVAPTRFRCPPIGSTRSSDLGARVMAIHAAEVKLAITARAIGR